MSDDISGSVITAVRLSPNPTTTGSACLISVKVKEIVSRLYTLSAYIGTIIIGVVGAFVFPGMIYEAIGATADYAGCIVIAFVWSILVGIKGATKASDVVDLFRDAAKIKALEAEAKKPKE